MYKVAFQAVGVNHVFSRKKFQWLLWIFTAKNIKLKYNVKHYNIKVDFVTVKVGITEGKIK